MKIIECSIPQFLSTIPRIELIVAPSIHPHFKQLRNRKIADCTNPANIRKPPRINSNF